MKELVLYVLGEVNFLAVIIVLMQDIDADKWKKVLMQIANK